MDKIKKKTGHLALSVDLMLEPTVGFGSDTKLMQLIGKEDWPNQGNFK